MYLFSVLYSLSSTFQKQHFSILQCIGLTKITEKFNTLFDWLDQGGTSEAVVGLEHVREYMSGNMMDMP